VERSNSKTGKKIERHENLTPPLSSPTGEEIKIPSPAGEGWGEVEDKRFTTDGTD